LDASIKFDPDEARRVLAAAGVTNLTLKTDVIGVSPYTELATAVQAQLADVGVTLDLNNLAGTEARAQWRTSAYDAFAGSISAGPDPVLTLASSYLGVDAVGGPSSADLSALVEDASKLAIGSPEREAALQKVSKYLTENPTHIMVCAPTLQWLSGTNVSVEPGAFYAYQRIFDPTFLGINK
jgi:peptide/nickel transport system substrate-binding protein